MADLSYAYINHTRYDTASFDLDTSGQLMDWKVTVEADLYHLLGESVPVVLVEGPGSEGERWSGTAIVVSADLDEARGAVSVLRGDGVLETRLETWARIRGGAA